MAGTNAGATYYETFGTTSPVSGSAPTLGGDGQPLNGLAGITLSVEAPAGSGLIGGSLRCYLYDQSQNPKNGSALLLSASYIGNLAFVNFDHQGPNNFQVGQVVRGAVSTISGTVVSVTTIAGGSGSLLLTPWSSGAVNFTVGEYLSGTTQPVWARLPSADQTVDASGSNVNAFAPFTVVTQRNSRIKWVPDGITFAPSGSGGVTVYQLGQTGQVPGNLDYLK